MPVEISVNEQFDVPVTRHVAVTKDINFEITVPQTYMDKETV